MPTPRFPTEVFPAPIVEIIEDAHDAMGYPLEYLSAAMIVATAGAMGNAWSIEVMSGWREKAIFYMAIVGNAGANKTHPMTFALAPLTKIDLDRIAEAATWDDYKAPPRLVVSDVTQEGLVKLHQKNPRGLVLFVDELKAWVANFSRYSGGSQEQFWLSNFSRTPIIVDRKSDAQPLSIAAPCISVIGSTQPTVLSSFATGDRSTNGFIDRMLFVIRPSAGKAYWSEKESDLALSKAWDYMLREMVEDEAQYDCKFTEEALEVAKRWQAYNVDLINSCNNERLVGHFSKLEIYFIRFCLVLHALYAKSYYPPEKREISAQTVENAVSLAEYFRAQTTLAQEYLYPDVDAQLSEKASLFYRSLPQTFTRKEAVSIGKSLGLSRSTCYRFLKQFEHVLIEINEEGEYYKLDND